MEKSPASIFNDVIGPVMRGPSSSHVAAAARIGHLARMAAGGKVARATVDFDTNGSLAESHSGHGTDMGMVCGLLGMELIDSRVDKSLALAKAQGMEVEFRVLPYDTLHPNNYRLSVISAEGTTHLWEGISVGGGMIEMQKLDGFSIQICGDYHELLVTVLAQQAPAVKRAILQKIPNPEYVLECAAAEKILFDVKVSQPVSAELVAVLQSLEGVVSAFTLAPVLPTASYAGCKVPFGTASELLAYAQNSPREMWQWATLYESMRGGTTEEEAYQKMDALTGLMLNCVQEGLQGTEYPDRILGPQAHLIAKSQANYPELLTGPLANIIRNITAIMEVKSAMGVIVAAPTAGSCGCLPGTVTGLGQALALGQSAMTQGLLAAGLVGVFIAEQATFAAEVAGCQAECGAGSAMAAAAAVQMLGGSVKQCVDAASLAMQNITGLVCDPVANRVEIPCLGKNVMGGANALSSATMVLAGYNAVIPLDETIQAMYDIGQQLPLALRCTLGGLGKTPTSCEICHRLAAVQEEP